MHWDPVPGCNTFPPNAHGSVWHNYPLLFLKLFSGSKASFKENLNTKRRHLLSSTTPTYQQFPSPEKSWIHPVSLNFHTPLSSKFSISTPPLPPSPFLSLETATPPLRTLFQKLSLLSCIFSCFSLPPHSLQYLNMLQVSLILERKKEKQLFTLFLIQLATTPFLFSTTRHC